MFILLIQHFSFRVDLVHHNTSNSIINTTSIFWPLSCTLENDIRYKALFPITSLPRLSPKWKISGNAKKRHVIACALLLGQNYSVKKNYCVTDLSALQPTICLSILRKTQTRLLRSIRDYHCPKEEPFKQLFFQLHIKFVPCVFWARYALSPNLQRMGFVCSNLVNASRVTLCKLSGLGGPF